MAGSDPLAPFVADPRGSAVLLDVDGTLAPIVERPGEAAVPGATLAVLERLVGRLALVGCVSGRRATEAARLVPVPGLVFAGNHGLETLDGDVLHVVPDVDPYLPDLRAAARELVPIAAGVGAWVEDKGPTLALHVREAPDPADAAAVLRREAVPLVRRRGLVARWGRQVLEVRPPVPVDKGTAVARLRRGRAVARVLYAGDDTTDVDAFRVADVAVAVDSAEAPPGLREAADLVVNGPDGLLPILRRLAGDA